MHASFYDLDKAREEHELDGGPKGALRTSTKAYWKKVKSKLKT